MQANPTATVLAWARRSSGLVPDEVARRLRVPVERIAAWEVGAEKPTLAQLRRLAAIYKRPLATFYLENAPKDFTVMADFRKLQLGIEPVDRSPELLFEVRRATDRRDWALELYADLDEKPMVFQGRASRVESPETVGSRIRELLGITTDRQRTWRTQYEALQQWRWLLEDNGILTFQATDIDVEEARGFSISQRPLPVVVMNSKDAPRGRVFTLLHELAHVMLNEAGVCDMHEGDGADVEPFCNRVAGAVLFPREALLRSIVVRRHPKREMRWSDEELSSLSREFGGSREAALVRLLTLTLTTQAFYEEKRNQYQKEYAELRRASKAVVPPHRRALASAGPLFTRLVVESFNRDRITASDVSDYLQIRVKHLPEIQRNTRGIAI